MKPLIRVAIIGAGAIGRTHANTLSHVQGMKLAALVDPFPEAAGLSEALGVAWFKDVNELISSGLADAAIIASPNETHLPISAALIKAGLPILVEKPIAENISSALELTRLAGASMVPVLIGHHRRHNPIIKNAFEQIRAGTIGDLVVANVVSTLAKDDAYFEAPWRRTAGAGGPLLINLIHEIDMLRHFFGEIEQVQALTSNVIRRLPVENSAAIAIRFASGALGSMIISDAAVGPWAWDITAGENPDRFPSHSVSAHHYAGTKGSLSLPDATVWKGGENHNWTQELKPVEQNIEAADPYEAQLLHFASLIRGEETQPLVSPADGTANLIVVEAIRKSGVTGCAEAIDLSPIARDLQRAQRIEP